MRTLSTSPHILLFSLLLASCADQGPSAYAEVCGQARPVSLLDLRSAEWGTVFGELEDQVFVATWVEGESGWDAEVDLRLVDKCGADERSLGVTQASADLQLGSDALYSNATAGVTAHPLDGGQPQQFAPRAFAFHLSNTHGIVTLGHNGGPLQLHTAPLDPNVEPITLVAETGESSASVPEHYVTSFWSNDSTAFALSLDASVVRVDLATHTTTPVIEDVLDFNVFDDGQHIVFAHDSDISVHDLRDGTTTAITPDSPQPLAYVHAQAGRWAIFHVSDRRVMHLDRREFLANAAGARSLYELSDGRILLETQTTPSENWARCRYDFLADDGRRQPFAEDIRCHVYDPARVTDEGLIFVESYPPSDVFRLPFDSSDPVLLGTTHSNAFHIIDDHVISLGFEDDAHQPNSAPLVMDGPDFDNRTLSHRAGGLPWVSGHDLFYFSVGHGPLRARLDL